MSDIFGWDLIYKVSVGSISKKEDNLVLLVHFLFIKNGFKCLGLGDSKTSSEDEKGSELLPAGWSDSASYSIRYICDKQSFILRGVPVNNSIVFNLLDTASLAVSNVALVADNEINEQSSDMKTLFTNANGLMRRITDNLINPVLERVKNNCDTSTQTPFEPPPPSQPINTNSLQSQRSRDSLRVDPLRDPLHIGRSDLDPLGGLGGFGGGMLFDPFNNRRNPDVSNQLPRGSIPPGARFDPFAPPGAGPYPGRPHRGPPDFSRMDPYEDDENDGRPPMYM